MRPRPVVLRLGPGCLQPIIRMRLIELRWVTLPPFSILTRSLNGRLNDIPLIDAAAHAEDRFIYTDAAAARILTSPFNPPSKTHKSRRGGCCVRARDYSDRDRIPRGAVIAYSSGSTNWCCICDVREQLSYNCLKRWRS